MLWFASWCESEETKKWKMIDECLTSIEWGHSSAHQLFRRNNTISTKKKQNPLMLRFASLYELRKKKKSKNYAFLVNTRNRNNYSFYSQIPSLNISSSSTCAYSCSHLLFNVNHENKKFQKLNRTSKMRNLVHYSFNFRFSNLVWTFRKNLILLELAPKCEWQQNFNKFEKSFSLPV